MKKTSKWINYTYPIHELISWTCQPMYSLSPFSEAPWQHRHCLGMLLSGCLHLPIGNQSWNNIFIL